MPLPKDQLELIGEDIEKATIGLAKMKDVIEDMRLAGMPSEKQEKAYDELSDRLRSLKVFHARQQAKATE